MHTAQACRVGAPADTVDTVVDPVTHPEVQHLTVADGIDLHVVTRGMSGPRRPMLLVHGLASNARLWDGVAEHLAAAGHPVVAVDQRGHGRSSKPDHGYDFATLVDDLCRVSDLLDLERPVAVGQSWGGNVVVEFAARRPDRIAGVVAVDGGFIELGRQFPSWDDCRATLTPPPLVGTPHEVIESYLRRAHPTWPESGIHGTLANFERRADGTIAPWLTLERHLTILGELYRHRPRDVFARIDLPVLFVPADSGHHERTAVTRRAVDEALDLLADGRVHWFAPADHDVHAQYPREVAAVLGAFARSLDDPPEDR